MKDHHSDVAERRLQLQQKAAEQRQELGMHMNFIDSRIRIADRGLVNVRRIVNRPVIIAGGAAVALIIGPRRALRLAGRAMLFVSATRRVFSLIR